jgi:hypothetical protein
MFNPLQLQFNRFMQQVKGRDPNELIQKLVSSGRISQQQLDAAQKQAEAYKSQFENMRKTFGL